jgi:peptidoglycan/xylan/chitin deacetylase (PgdA/CDA1 family)
MRVRSLARSVMRRAGLVPPRPVILMYHRIAKPPVDPWSLSVSPEGFDRQMAWLRANRKVVGLDQLASDLTAGRPVSGTVAITFDDGYRDNLLTAKPILEKHGLPATVFLATGLLGSPVEYWWDELARLILRSGHAASTSLELAGQRISLQWTATTQDESATWRAADGAVTPRQVAYLAIWTALLGRTHPEIEACLIHLRASLPDALPADAADLPMALQDVAELVSSGVITVGAHTLTHPHLPSHSAESQAAEVIGSISACLKLSGQDDCGFAFPYGAISAQVLETVRSSGARWAVSTRLDGIRASDDPFAMPRLQVATNDLPEFIRAINAVS